MPDLILKDVYYQYPGSKQEVLKGVNAYFPTGKVTAVCGRSGAGKSTLLYLLAGLDVPKRGEMIYQGKPITRSMLDDYRRTESATIAQSYLLFPTRTALENAEYTLYEGDSIRIPPAAAHRWENRSDRETSVVFAVSPPSF